MLSWSAHTANIRVDLDAIAFGSASSGLHFGSELVSFTEAIAGYDDEALEDARERLSKATSTEFMVDAAAVAANFEMMTRVADGTGARFDEETKQQRATLVEALGITGLESLR